MGQKAKAKDRFLKRITSRANYALTRARLSKVQVTTKELMETYEISQVRRRMHDATVDIT